jgi:hypothetical protein
VIENGARHKAGAGRGRRARERKAG